jgi:ribosomal protein L11 methylase PrmA
MSLSVDPGSFRDPSGFIFYREETLLRQVQSSYQKQYDLLTGSGLYQALVDAGLMISHAEESLDIGLTADAYRVLRPERVPFISYPYEWCFSQLKDAALATLQIQKEALRFGMTLKDASTYNIQFREGKPTLIDTLSFEKYEEGRPWVAYKQFCQHFLAPLVLMSRTDVRLQQLLRINMDGIPLDLASRLLPRGTWLQPGILTHIHLHGAAQKRYEGEAVRRSGGQGQGQVSRTGMLGLIDSLEGTVRAQTWKPAGTTWAEYYSATNYSDEAMGGKRRLVAELLDAVVPAPKTVWDLGGNTGLFSRVASTRGIQTLSMDIDPAAVEKNYLECRANRETHLLPLLGDLTNPSPDLGWALHERRSLTARGPADLLLALALIHHLAIGNNVPLAQVARYFRSLGEWLIIEFVPKSDSQVQRLLASREDIFTDYTVAGFETAFRHYFEFVRSVPVPDSERTLYLLRGHPSALFED